MAADDSIRQFFDEMAIGRDAAIAANPIVDYEQRMRSRMVVELLQPKRGERILDVGCGNGRDLIALAAIGCNCVAIDYSEVMVAEARHVLATATSAVYLNVGDATQLGFKDGQFDKVFASEVIEHIPDWRRAVSEMRRVLKPGGILVITTPNRRSWYGFDRYVLLERLLRIRWKHPFDEWKTRDEVASALSDAGMRLETVAGVCYAPGILTYRLPRVIQRGIVGMTSLIERSFSRMLAAHGYMLALRAVKLPFPHQEIV